MSDILIHFPYMHKEFVLSGLQDRALFLNPGLDIKDNDNYFLPESLVLSAQEARSYLNECLRFGEQFKKPSDMAYFGLKGFEDFYADTTLAIKSELLGLKEQKKSDQRFLELKRAQMLLLLRYALEERLIELGQIDEKLKKSWQKFEEVLGVEKDDEDILARATFQAHSMCSTGSSPMNVEADQGWEKLLHPFALFLPENGKLMVVEQKIKDGLAEMNLPIQKEIIGGEEVFLVTLQSPFKK